MSFSSASLLILGVYALTLAPLGVAVWKPATLVAVLPVYWVLLGALLIYHSGFIGRDQNLGAAASPPARQANLPPAPPQRRAAAALSINPLTSDTPSPESCAQIIAVAERGRLLERAGARLIVDKALWARVPRQAQDAIVKCAEVVQKGKPRPVEVVARD